MRSGDSHEEKPKGMAHNTKAEVEKALMLCFCFALVPSYSQLLLNSCGVGTEKVLLDVKVLSRLVILVMTTFVELYFQSMPLNPI